MARFDVFRFSFSRAPLVLDVQANLLSHLSSRVVVPLLPSNVGKREELPRLKPVLIVAGRLYNMITTDIVAIPASQLGPFVENIEADHGDEILSALDFLFSGF